MIIKIEKLFVKENWD